MSKNLGVARHSFLWVLAVVPVIFLPSFALAQSLAVSPAKVKVDNLPPGETASFNLTVGNKDEVAQVFVFTTLQPPQEQRTDGRAPFPDDSWISFSPLRLAVPASSEANVTVTVAIPREQELAGQDWETWLGIASESSDLLVPKLYVRLLVSTSAPADGGVNPGVVAGITVGVALLAYGGYYYFRRRSRPE